MVEPAPPGSTSWIWTSRSKARLGTSRWCRRSPRCEVRVQAGGGVRTPDEVDALLAAGADRVVLGSAGARRTHRTRECPPQREGERLIVGIEVGGDGEIRSRGRDPVDLPLMETLGWLAAARASHVPCHGRGQGGFDRAGPDVGALQRVVRAGRPVLAAGGIALRRGPPGPAGGRRRRAPWSGEPPSRAPWTWPKRSLGPRLSDRRLDSPPHGVPHRSRRPASDATSRSIRWTTPP